MFNYHTLKMFVHGETGEDIVKGYRKFNYVDTNNYDAEMFLHFGDDTSNYYEYRAPVRSDWTGNDIAIKFSDLTSLKALLDSTRITRKVEVPGGPPGATYRVRGNPRLDRIQFISIGLENPSGKGAQTLNGELWVDELRLTDVDDTRGWAYKMDASIKLADIGSIAFSLSQRDPYFHGLEDHFGSRNTSRAWSLSTSFAFDKLLPESWLGSVLNFSYSHSESINKPLYVPGTDVLVENAAARVAADTSTNPNRQYKNADDVRAQSEDISITDSYALPTLRLNIPSKLWLVTETINKITLGYSYTKSHQRNASTEYADAWSWVANFKYGTQFNPNNFLTLGSLKFFFTPQTMNFGATLNRSQSVAKSRAQLNPNDPVRTLNAQRSMDFTWQFFQGGLFDLGVVYNVNIASSLSHLETDQYQQQRPFTAILGDIFFSDRLIDFGVDQNYNQGITFNTKVTAPQLLSLDKILTPNFRYNVNYSWANNIQAGPIGRSAGWSGGPAFSLDINLKPMTDAIWSPGGPLLQAPIPADSSKKGTSFNLSKPFDQVSRILFKNTLFDFEKFTFNFTQSNTS
jgi:cell surface protein SprA